MPISQLLPAWLISALRILHEIDAGASVVGGAVTAALLGGQYGPAAPPDIALVLPSRPEFAAGIEREMSRRMPAIAWHTVYSWPDPARSGQFGTADDLSIAVQWTSARMVDQQPAVFAHHPDTWNDYHHGQLTDTDGSAKSVAARAFWCSVFPGLQPDRPVVTSVTEIGAAVTRGEPHQRAWERVFDRSAQPAVDAIRDWHRSAIHEIQELPLIDSAGMPAGDPWFSPDRQFRAWLRSVSSLDEPTSSDPIVGRALSAQCSRQKPTHLGWLTYQHALYATLLLDTTECHPSDRRAMRIGVLLHDIAKAENLWSPGAHGAIGSVRWRDCCACTDLSRDEERLITWLIKTHDYLGRLDRTIKNPRYRGGLSLERVRRDFRSLGRPMPEAVALNAAIVQADVGSTASLRWLLPLTPLLRDLVLPGDRLDAASTGRAS